MDNNFNNPWEEEKSNDSWGQEQKVKDNASFIKGIVVGLTVTLTFFIIVLVANILIGKDYIETDDKQQMLENAGFNPDGSSKNDKNDKKDTVDLDEAFDKAEYIQELIEKYFYYEDDIANIEEGVYAGMLAALGDPYSVYYTEEAFDAMMESTSGSYCGIGVVVQQAVDTMIITVVNPYKGCPGFEAGLRPGDIILGADDIDFTGMDINEAVSYIRGEENTTVTYHLAVVVESADGELSPVVKTTVEVPAAPAEE